MWKRLSLKKLHKRIMLSAAYQQSAIADAKTATADPENRLLAHQNRRRFDFETMRDSGARRLEQVGHVARRAASGPVQARSACALGLRVH
ncbi:MAG: DUF1553 domain-containing protein [Gemmataceae bacterium]